MAAVRKKSSSKLVLGCVVVALLVVTVAALELTNVTHIFHQQKAVSGPIKPIKVTTPHHPVPTSDVKNTGLGGNSTSPSYSSGSTATLVAPYGALVSNHKPGQNGTSATEQSECITTPGASCYMKIIKGDVVKTLPTQKVDSSGVTFWVWDIKSAGLTTGSWQVQAVAALGSQTKSTTDQRPLEVQ